jgi:hypothetical protein
VPSKNNNKSSWKQNSLFVIKNSRYEERAYWEYGEAKITAMYY